MASNPYQEIRDRLPKLKPSEVWALMSDLEALLHSKPKRSLKEFEARGPLNEKSIDWLKDLRGEWKARLLNQSG